MDEPAGDVEAEGVFHGGAGNAGDFEGIEGIHGGAGLTEGFNFFVVAIEDALGGAENGGALREGAEEHDGLVEADERGRVGEAGGVERAEEFFGGASGAGAEVVAGGFELGEEAFRRGFI